MFERVMIVDDNKLDRFITAHVLRKADTNITCQEFESAARALEYLEQIREQPERQPQIIVLDVLMPELNGLAFLEKLAMIPGYPAQCCIAVMLSSDLCASDLALAERLPFAKTFINKPFSPSSIAEVRALYMKSFSCEVSS